ncbi:MAG: hypothetical protein ACI4V7_11160 [Succinivibrionaceae bacterium]
MGTGFKGGATNYHSILDNLPKVSSIYKYQNGLFGNPGNKYPIREIVSTDHINASKVFYDLLAYGGIQTSFVKGKYSGIKTVMSDGTVVTYRKITSTENSPAVEISIRNSKSPGSLKQQKIHFIEGKL